MMKSRKGMKQLCLTIPITWHDELFRLARIKSVEEDRNIRRTDLIREAIAKTYNMEYKDMNK